MEGRKRRGRGRKNEKKKTIEKKERKIFLSTTSFGLCSHAINHLPVQYIGKSNTFSNANTSILYKFKSHPSLRMGKREIKVKKVERKKKIRNHWMVLILVNFKGLRVCVCVWVFGGCHIVVVTYDVVRYNHKPEFWSVASEFSLQLEYHLSKSLYGPERERFLLRKKKKADLSWCCYIESYCLSPKKYQLEQWMLMQLPLYQMFERTKSSW